jgi:hypothetical protein
MGIGMDYLEIINRHGGAAEAGDGGKRPGELQKSHRELLRPVAV